MRVVRTYTSTDGGAGVAVRRLHAGLLASVRRLAHPLSQAAAASAPCHDRLVAIGGCGLSADPGSLRRGRPAISVACRAAVATTSSLPSREWTSTWQGIP